MKENMAHHPISSQNPEFHHFPSMSDKKILRSMEKEEDKKTRQKSYFSLKED